MSASKVSATSWPLRGPWVISVAVGWKWRERRTRCRGFARGATCGGGAGGGGRSTSDGLARRAPACFVAVEPHPAMAMASRTSRAALRGTRGGYEGLRFRSRLLLAPTFPAMEAAVPSARTRSWGIRMPALREAAAPTAAAVPLGPIAARALLVVLPSVHGPPFPAPTLRGRPP